jgi:hypothetical protein
MNTIEELQNKIKSLETRIEQSKKLLDDAETGEVKLSFVAQASTESSIEKNTFLLEKYLQQFNKLAIGDIDNFKKEEKLKEEIQRRNYFKYQIQRIKRDSKLKQTEIDNALIIIDELPEEIQIEDSDIVEIGNKSKELFLDIHSNLDDDLLEIKNEFLKLVENHFNENNNDLKLLNYRIPIIILQLRTLLHNVKENIEELNLKKFRGFPRFQDWWIQELWISHQAYISLFKGKKIVMSLFMSCEQRKAFESIFASWILIKKILNVKGENGYFYNCAFDKMILKYADLEEETEEANLVSLENIVAKTTQQINLTAIYEKDILINEYVKFKIEKKNLEKKK